jgi:hypothetical protein
MFSITFTLRPLVETEARACAFDEYYHYADWALGMTLPGFEQVFTCHEHLSETLALNLAEYAGPLVK